MGRPKSKFSALGSMQDGSPLSIARSQTDQRWAATAVVSHIRTIVTINVVVSTRGVRSLAFVAADLETPSATNRIVGDFELDSYLPRRIVSFVQLYVFVELKRNN